MTAKVPAMRQAQDAIAAHLRSSVGDVSWFIDRSDVEAIPQEDFPAGIIRLVSVSFVDVESGTQRQCLCDLQFDFLSGETVDLTIDAVNQRSIAWTMKALWEAMQDADSAIAKIFEEIEPVSVDSSEQSTPDAGWAVLQCRAIFYILRDDPFVIVPRL